MASSFLIFQFLYFNIMKTYIPQTFARTLIALTFATGGVLTTTHVSAAAPAAVANAKSTLTAQVAVPSDGEPLTYMLKGKKVTVKPGETAKIPAGAKQINLPANAIFTVTSYRSGAEGASSNQYTVVKPVTLSALSPEALKSNDKAFVLTKQDGRIKLPSVSIGKLVNILRGSTDTTVNPFNVLVVPQITDGNR